MTTEMTIFSLTFIVCCFVFVFLFLRKLYKNHYVSALVLKGIASLCFVAIGVINMVLSGFSPVKLLILVGLCLGIIGDEALALCPIYPRSDLKHFLGGGVFFVVGHVLYVFSMILRDGPNWIALALSFATLLLISYLYEKKRDFYVGEMKNSLKLYIVIVIFFASVGVSSFLRHGIFEFFCFALGGVLFTVSDNILFAYKFSKNPKFVQNVALHIAYYVAQLSIACSIAFV